MKKNLNYIKLALDLLLIIVITLLFNKSAINLAFHEFIGLVVFGLLAIHLTLNLKWIKVIFKKFKTMSTKTKVSSY